MQTKKIIKKRKEKEPPPSLDQAAQLTGPPGPAGQLPAQPLPGSPSPLFPRPGSQQGHVPARPPRRRRRREGIRPPRRLGLHPSLPLAPSRSPLRLPSPRSTSPLSLSFVLERRPTRSPPFSVVLAATKTRSPRRPVQPLRLPRLRLPDELQDAGRPRTLPRPRLPLRITGARRRRSTAQQLLNLPRAFLAPRGEPLILSPRSPGLLSSCSRRSACARTRRRGARRRQGSGDLLVTGSSPLHSPQRVDAPQPLRLLDSTP